MSLLKDMSKPIPEPIKLKIQAYKKIFPKATIEEIAQWCIKDLGKKVAISSIRNILKRDVSPKTLERIEEKFVEQYSGAIVEARKRASSVDSEILARAKAQLNVLLGKDFLEARDLIGIIKSLQPQVDMSVEMLFTPEKLQQFETLTQALDEAIKQKQTTIKISQRISKAGSIRVGDNEERPENDSPDGEGTGQ